MMEGNRSSSSSTIERWIFVSIHSHLILFLHLHLCCRSSCMTLDTLQQSERLLSCRAQFSFFVFFLILPSSFSYSLTHTERMNEWENFLPPLAR
jgi:hypothetical protein